MTTKRITTATARNSTQRAFDDWRTIPAARCGVSSKRWVAGGAEKRSTGAGSDGGRRAGRRSSGPRPGSVIGCLGDGTPRGRGGGWTSRGSDAAGGALGRDEPRLAKCDGQRAERDLAGVERQHARAVDRGREPIHTPRRRPELRAGGLDAEPVVAGAVAGALHPV